VAGKGSPAALLAAAVLGMFSSESMYQSAASPLITRLNKGLFRRGIESRFLTTFYGILTAEGALLYTNAGHNPPILLSPDGTVRRLETGGTVLGLFEQAEYQEEGLCMKPGDVLITFSDGVTEALNPAGEEFGDERLVEVVSAKRGDAPQAILDHLLLELRQFCATQADDITLVLVRYNT
jgi:sigma-B regulation protein RsbU (phosphoserine phosphatase)